ncbi:MULTISPECIES: glycoside hydrolase family 15 protein [unclassified Kribbella]|uniref:glycoside hydrolase family 15 protein n=1 Tax=unclassified Kribbella TaxID=2644121 RepID=UPI0033D9836C
MRRVPSATDACDRSDRQHSGCCHHLPETIGGSRNWDYRYSWLRDATFTLRAFLATGHLEEVAAWRDWLVRTVVDKPSDLQIMYAVDAHRPPI